MAQRSSEAAREIAGLIASSSSQVKRGVGLVGQAGEAMGGIESSVTEIYGAVSEIASSAREQSTGLAEINTAVNQLDQVTQQNAAMFEQTTAASHSLTREAETLAATTAQFRIGAASTALSPLSCRRAAPAAARRRPDANRPHRLPLRAPPAARVGRASGGHAQRRSAGGSSRCGAAQAPTQPIGRISSAARLLAAAGALARRARLRHAQARGRQDRRLAAEPGAHWWAIC